MLGLLQTSPMFRRKSQVFCLEGSSPIFIYAPNVLRNKRNVLRFHTKMQCINQQRSWRTRRHCHVNLDTPKDHCLLQAPRLFRRIYHNALCSYNALPSSCNVQVLVALCYWMVTAAVNTDLPVLHTLLECRPEQASGPDKSSP